MTGLTDIRDRALAALNAAPIFTYVLDSQGLMWRKYAADEFIDLTDCGSITSTNRYAAEIVALNTPLFLIDPDAANLFTADEASHLGLRLMSIADQAAPPHRK